MRLLTCHCHPHPSHSLTPQVTYAIERPLLSSPLRLSSVLLSRFPFLLASPADNVAVQGKSSLSEALKKCLRRMRPKAPFSHNATNYDKWMTATEPYTITYSPQVWLHARRKRGGGAAAGVGEPVEEGRGAGRGGFFFIPNRDPGGERESRLPLLVPVRTV